MQNNIETAGGKQDFCKELPNDKTTHTAEADMSLGVEKNCQKDNKEQNERLLSAYNSLQSEFTRRCQRIKELERENDILKTEQSNKNSVFDIDDETYSKEFIKNYPEVSMELKSLNDIAESKGDKSYGRLERAYLDTLKRKIEENERFYKSNDFILNSLNSNQNLKEQIIREYLESIQGSKPTVKLISGDGKASIMPPSKPKTLADAGIIAQQILDKFKEI